MLTLYAAHHGESLSARSGSVNSEDTCSCSVIDDPRVTEKILRHLGAWPDPSARPPPQGVRGPYTYEPCLDADPMPDYENVLTD